MSKIVVIADDLTGANASSILLKKNGYQAATFLDMEAYGRARKENLDVVSISTDSRALEASKAYGAVEKVVRAFKDEDVEFFSKRIDSTLRGNIGSEIKAVMDGLDDSALALMVPAYPASGRIVIGNHMLVNGLPLSRTSVAKDPKTPVNYSQIHSIVRESYQAEIGLIYLDTVEKGASAIEEEIRAHFEDGKRLIIFDAFTDLDIENIASAANDSGLNIFSVDPGPFTQALARERLKDESFDKKIMLTIGSVTDVTMGQIEVLEKEEKVFLEEIDALKLIYDGTREEEIERVTASVAGKIDDYDLFGLVSSKDRSQLLDLRKIGQDLGLDEDQVSIRIAQGLAQVTKNIMDLRGQEISGLYTSGGDITVAVCKELGSVGISMIDEVMPLAVYGKLKDGEFDGLSIITKGGLIGSEKALVECVDFLRRR